MIYNKVFGTEDNLTSKELAFFLSGIENKELTICGVNGVVLFDNADRISIEIYEQVFDKNLLDTEENYLEKYFDSLQEAYIYRDLDIKKFIEILNCFEDKEVEICGENGIVILEAAKEISLDFLSSCHSEEALNEAEEIYKLPYNIKKSKEGVYE